MGWIERVIGTFEQQKEQRERKEKELEKLSEELRRRAAKDIVGLIRTVTGERIKAERLVELPIDRKAHPYFEGTLYGVVGLNGIEFGVHDYSIAERGGGPTYYHFHQDLVVLQRDRESGLWTFQVTNTEIELGRILKQRMRTGERRRKLW